MALVEAGFAASASAFFLASLARRLRSASRLPEATRAGFFFFVAGFVFGGSAVTRAGVVAGAGVSSGIVSSGCVAIVYIGGSKSSKFLRDSFKVPPRFLPGCTQVAATWWWCLLEQHRSANYIKALEWVAFDVSAGVCGLRFV